MEQVESMLVKINEYTGKAQKALQTGMETDNTSNNIFEMITDTFGKLTILPLDR